jgi:short-subunit dehydrogenase
MATAGPLRVVITGASSGIGAALARIYAQRGATLGLIARRASALHELAGSLRTTAEVYRADVRDAEAMRAAAHDFIAHHGCPHVIIANAGIGYGTLTEQPDDYAAFRDIMDVNVAGLVATFQPYVEPMRAARGGTLVGIASVAGYRGLPGAEAYCASKAAAISYLESLRVRLAPSGISVVTLSPGYIDTAMTRGNPYPMPFLLDADTAARRMAALIDRRVSFAVLPWQMAIVARLLRIVPNWLFDRALAEAPRKPRRDARN